MTTVGDASSILSFEPPSAEKLHFWLTPMRLWHRPSFYGFDRIHLRRPTMFVGNHTLYGVQDVPHIMCEFQRIHGIVPRALADRAHFRIPIWGDFLTSLGCVEGTRDNCRVLMKAGQHIIVFPGGAREVFKRKGEAYKLVWKERTGFVELAAAHGYQIIPFASLGADESFDMIIDAKDIMNSPLGSLLEVTAI